MVGRRWAWFAIGALAFAVRLAYVLSWSRNAHLGFDGNTYYELGKRLADDHAYLSVIERRRGSTVLFPPGFPLVIAVLRVLGAGTRTKVLVGLAALGTATVIGIALVARRVAGDAVALVAGTLGALYPNLFLAEGALMSEALIAFLVAYALLLLLRARERPTPARFAMAGVPLGAIAITRSDGWLLAGLLVAVAVGGLVHLARPRRLALVSVALAATIVFLGAWEVRNATRTHAFVPVAVNSWSVVAGANCERAYYGPRIGSWYVECLDFARVVRHGHRGEVDVNRAMAADGVRYARAHVGRLPVVMAARAGLTFGVYHPLAELDVEAFFEGRNDGLAHAGYFMYLALAALAVVGAVTAWRRRGAALRLLVAPLAVVVVATLAGYGNQRFRMPFEPSLVVLAAIGTCAVVRGLRVRAGG